MKREIPVEQAIGLRLAHDLTRIVPGEFKGRAFKLGHVIQEEDIPLLLDIGKRHVYVLELGPDEMHENDAAEAMAKAVAGDGLTCSDAHEGKVVLKARHPGVLCVDAERVHAINRIDGISFTTRSPWVGAQAGMSVAGIKPIPLVIERAKIEHVMTLANAGEGPVLDVLPFRMKQAALVTTGSEVQSGRIVDKFGPVLQEKLKVFGVDVVRQTFPGDEVDDIAADIVRACEAGIPLVLVTGGMSVDPDDRSPGAIAKIATHVVSYGTPMLPGSMMMLAYRGNTAIFGLPGAVIYDPRTSFDVLLPRVLAGLPVTREDIAVLGVGGWLND